MGLRSPVPLCISVCVCVRVDRDAQFLCLCARKTHNGEIVWGNHHPLLLPPLFVSISLEKLLCNSTILHPPSLQTNGGVDYDPALCMGNNNLSPMYVENSQLSLKLVCSVVFLLVVLCSTYQIVVGGGFHLN